MSNLPTDLLDQARALPAVRALAGLALLNLVAFAAALLLGTILTRLFRHRRITALPAAVTRLELGLAAASIALNTLVTFAGWLLWRAEVLVIPRGVPLWRGILDFLVVLLAMDLSMYLLHRLVHWRWLYPIHRHHHRFERTRPLTLFVVHPLETLGFGALWLVVISLVDPSLAGLCLYMAANLLAGLLGHLGVEPLPRRCTRVPIVRELGTSTFHARHHLDVGSNFGFYTVAWDRLFGTLSEDYDATFGSPLDPGPR